MSIADRQALVVRFDADPRPANPSFNLSESEAASPLAAAAYAMQSGAIYIGAENEQYTDHGLDLFDQAHDAVRGEAPDTRLAYASFAGGTLVRQACAVMADSEQPAVRLRHIRRQLIHAEDAIADARSERLPLGLDAAHAALYGLAAELLYHRPTVRTRVLSLLVQQEIARHPEAAGDLENRLDDTLLLAASANSDKVEPHVRARLAARIVAIPEPDLGLLIGRRAAA